MKKFYGGLRPHTVIGADSFRSHDATKTWDDQGISKTLASEIAADVSNILVTDLAAYGAHQVRDGVLDYITNSYLDLAVIDGTLCVCIDASNDESSLRACFDLVALLKTSARQSINAGDGTVFDALVGLIDHIPGAAPTPAPPAPVETIQEVPNIPVGKVVRTPRRQAGATIGG